MTIERRADQVLPPVLDDLAGNAKPDYLDDVLSATGRMGQRRASATIQRWFPWFDSTGASAFGPSVPWRGVVVALVILVLLVAGLVLVAGAWKERPAPPFGLAVPGLVSFVDGNDIVATLPDGTGRHSLITGNGLKWGAVWSHRGDRFTYWLASATTSDPTSLWMADRDGSHQHRLTGNLMSEQSDVFPSMSWSPDDQQVAFADAGDLYVVNADGSDLHVVGKRTGHDRDTPVWSPDGSLIAYSGQALNAPDNTRDLWVITPDGLHDTEVIPAAGVNEIGTNTNPSWSPDSRSLLAFTGGGNNRNSISIARRDAAGVWAPPRQIISGPNWNYMPAWSTAGTQFTFLRAVEDTDGGPYLVMVADADGINVDVHSLSTRQVGLATPCWSPDDQFVRAAGIAPAGDRTIVLLPLDDSEPVDIPALGDAPTAGCDVQRRAP